MKIYWFVFMGLGFVFSPAWSAIEVYQFDDPELERRYRSLVAELRCPKCQNQNLADSDAPLAKDIKDKIYAKIQSGESSEAVVEYMVGRYGNFIRYKPPFALNTAFLWLFPLFLIFVFIATIFGLVRRHRIDWDGNNEMLFREKALELQRECIEKSSHVEDV